MLTGSYSFTTVSEGLANVLVNECEISKAWLPSSGLPPPEKAKFRAVWDTGATTSVISQNVVDACELVPIGATRVTGVLASEIADVFLVNILLPNQVGITELPVTLAKFVNPNVLIGMDIIGRGDFAVTHAGGNTKFSFRMPSQADIDFVQESRMARLS